MPYEHIEQAVMEGNPRLAVRLIREALNAGENARDILEGGLLSAMRRMGMDFQEDEGDIARVLACARAMKAGLAELEPQLENDGKVCKGKVILGTAGGDLHDLGKNIVAIMFRSAGFQVVDVGVDVSAGQFVRAVKENPDADIVCISSLLTTSLPEMRHIVQSLNAMPNRSQFHVMVGGGPVTEEFARKIGADAYTDNAVEAAELAETFVQ
jgi:methylmalonyl-CoA mutase cobalamin-binding domain/chain